ncbi:hypothetical protein E3N88_34579 [Mikania micrantha]|uniref:Reverse transcriptase Ty1/copia-type domain-containing protein n=1 Tax=Mikania micrantha TaxID=192012 RepID=A0A5N6LYI8_9ASTR|nr:hypothetical protein E3N88_34579 [Mikania micrantha]
MEDEHKIEWVEAMQDEMNSLYENNTFELVKLPKGKRALKNKWVYKLKTEEHTSRPRYKARLVVKGFRQRKGIDFDEIFSPVVKMSSDHVKRTAANKKKKRGEEEEFSSLAEPTSISVSFPEFQQSDRLHFWTASSSHPGELIQRWVLFNNVRNSGCRASVHI